MTTPIPTPATFWEQSRAALSGQPGGGLNIGWAAVDRNVERGLGARVAIRWLGRDGERREFTYRELQAQTDRFASALTREGLAPGGRVFALCDRVPELYVAVLGALKAGCVFCPLFSAFGPEPVHQRMSAGRATVLVTTPRLLKRKVEPIRARLPHLERVILVGPFGDWRETMALGEAEFECVRTRPGDPALLHFTSGTTGKPKGALHVHEAVVAHHATGKLALDLRDGDVFWCTADPGWVTGTSYGIVAPLVHGVTMVIDEADFDAERWYRILQEEQVTVWYTAPTAVRMLMRAGGEMARAYEPRALRYAASVGEPLNPEAVRWSMDVLGLPIRDNWWQTETGGIMIANRPGLEVRPGSMGQPLPGVEAAVVRGTPQGVELLGPDEEGELALRTGWPSMFREYLDQPEKYASCFRDGWYLTGDLVRRDPDGYYWFVGRADDVIKSAGHLVGPFEVESALMEHADVAEVAVIGKPDPIAGALIKAWVLLKPGVEPSDELRRALIGFARKRLGPAVAPREIEFADDLPRTRSGKIMRRLLKARELGLDEGDTSTLETRA